MQLLCVCTGGLHKTHDKPLPIWLMPLLSGQKARDGIDGEKGEKGWKGYVGGTGPNGDVGETGDRGAPGDTGPRGGGVSSELERNECRFSRG